ncbi:hypothetical protein [Flavobacterium quisquiliarum]|jgi:hypothetical protein|uniref:Lipoprotein n=1 Tax=Flavobacterium quisquiliarum TaxID=1834436 RepID=A0ABV8WCE1_9FLAO|nr:hypothetical protein [Flavobacterium quisquiliarum]MBW1656707.1 hypothetical protein [Flavobacterium quisquiliarum]NWL00332.1 hypothetical protein [Flavobacterium collinsii]
MRFPTCVTVFLLLALGSCKSSKVADFKKSLDQSERRAFEIVVGKEGPGEKKLQCLEKEDYKGALKAVKQQSLEFDKLISHIRKLSADGIPKGKPLKTAYLEYYESLKELHAFDRKEIEQQEVLQTLKDNELKNGHNTLIVLAREKKKLFAAVYEKEALLHTAAEDFKTSNGF